MVQEAFPLGHGPIRCVRTRCRISCLHRQSARKNHKHQAFLSGCTGQILERSPRAWDPHERLTVAVELATALPHSAQRPRLVVEESREGEVGEA